MHALAYTFAYTYTYTYTFIPSCFISSFFGFCRRNGAEILDRGRGRRGSMGGSRGGRDGRKGKGD